MSSHESVVIVGKLSRDPELKYSASGKAVAKFSIPVDRRSGGERKTVWWNVVSFEKTAESVKENLHKGSVVRVEGVVGVDADTMNPRVYEQNGAHKSVLELIANRVDYIDNFGGGEKKADAPVATQDEIPF